MRGDVGICRGLTVQGRGIDVSNTHPVHPDPNRRAVIKLELGAELERFLSRSTADQGGRGPGRVRTYVPQKRGPAWERTLSFLGSDKHSHSGDRNHDMGPCGNPVCTCACRPCVCIYHQELSAFRSGLGLFAFLAPPPNSHAPSAIYLPGPHRHCRNMTRPEHTAYEHVDIDVFDIFVCQEAKKRGKKDP